MPYTQQNGCCTNMKTNATSPLIIPRCTYFETHWEHIWNLKNQTGCTLSTRSKKKTTNTYVNITCLCSLIMYVKYFTIIIYTNKQINNNLL